MWWGLIVITVIVAILVTQVGVLVTGRRNRQHIDQLMLTTRLMRTEARRAITLANDLMEAFAAERAAAGRELSRHPGPTPGEELPR